MLGPWPRVSSAGDERFQASLQLRNELGDFRPSNKTTPPRSAFDLQMACHWASSHQTASNSHFSSVRTLDNCWLECGIVRWRIKVCPTFSRLLRRPGEQFAMCNVSPGAFGGGSVIVWYGIRLEARTEFHAIACEGYPGGICYAICSIFLFLIFLLKVLKVIKNFLISKSCWKEYQGSESSTNHSCWEWKNGRIGEHSSRCIARVIQWISRRLEAIRLARGNVTRY